MRKSAIMHSLHSLSQYHGARAGERVVSIIFFFVLVLFYLFSFLYDLRVSYAGYALSLVSGPKPYLKTMHSICTIFVGPCIKIYDLFFRSMFVAVTELSQMYTEDNFQVTYSFCSRARFVLFLCDNNNVACVRSSRR